ncbi:MAG: hypothetical protein PVI26_09385 [Chitinispirillia bacterium]|jgi:pectate lyase
MLLLVEKISETVSLLLFFYITVFAVPDFEKCAGFASIDGEGNQKLVGGVTGGAGGQIVTVKNVEDLVKYCSQKGPLTIVIEGTIKIPNDKNLGTLTEAKKANPGFTKPAVLPYSVWVTSDKTIIGKGKNAVIKSGGFVIGSWDEEVGFNNSVVTPPADAIHNIIIRNITFDLSGGPKSETDGISIFMHAHHIWVDHCSFKSTPDGALDVKRGSNYCTFSYNHFMGTNKTCLCGHNDGNGKQDIGFLKTTYHHNYFQSTKQRGPRVRFGMVHVLNNYYSNIGSYGIGTGKQCRVYSEKNILEGGTFSKNYGGGVYEDHGSVIKGDKGGGREGSVGWKPSDFYSYTADEPATAKELATKYAGAGKVDFEIKTGLKPIFKTITPSHNIKKNKNSRFAFSLLGKNYTNYRGIETNKAVGIYITGFTNKWIR